MIKFFRRIRQGLLSQNRFKKYLVYAIGEIILVVIGIMIALSINKQYDYIKERKEEANILKSIQSDLLASKSKIEKVIKRQESSVRKTDSLINLFEYYQSGVNRDSLVKSNEEKIGNYLNKGVFQWQRAEPITGTYDALIGSGKTELILSSELKRKLAEYSTIIKSGFEDQGTATNILTLIVEKQSKYVGAGVWKFGKKIRNESFIYTDKRSRNKAIHSLLNDHSFEGLLIPHRSLETLRLYNQKRLLKFTEELLDLVKKEIQ